jgi:hypothetical protein
MNDQPGWIKLAQERDGAVLQAGGAWTIEHAAIHSPRAAPSGLWT